MKKTVLGLAIAAFFLLIPGQLEAEAKAVKLTGSFGVYNPPPFPPVPPNPLSLSLRPTRFRLIKRYKFRLMVFRFSNHLSLKKM